MKIKADQGLWFKRDFKPSSNIHKYSSFNIVSGFIKRNKGRKIEIRHKTYSMKTIYVLLKEKDVLGVRKGYVIK